MTMEAPSKWVTIERQGRKCCLLAMHAIRLILLALVVICMPGIASGQGDQLKKDRQSKNGATKKVPFRFRPGDPLQIKIQEPASAGPDINSYYNVSLEGKLKMPMLAMEI